LKALLAFGVFLPFDLQPGRLGLEIRGVIALVGVGASTVKLKDPLGDIVEKVAVVRDGNNGSRVLLEVLFEPQHALGV
jgi:hypothetical protein